MCGAEDLNLCDQKTLKTQTTYMLLKKMLTVSEPSDAKSVAYMC